MMEIIGNEAFNPDVNRVVLVNTDTKLEQFDLDTDQLAYIASVRNPQDPQKAMQIITVNLYKHWLVLVFPDPQKKNEVLLESYRLDGAGIQSWANKNQITQLCIEDLSDEQGRLFATVEGLVLSNYQFLPYFSEAEKKKNCLASICIKGMPESFLRKIIVLTEAVSRARDLVNEPLSSLNAPRFADEIIKMSQKSGIQIDVFDKERIEKEKMGGLLAVNKGSIDPPRFCILNYHPENPINEKPLVLIGKGIVYDTGGLSLKPTPNSMDYMKSDMAGAAAVTGVMYAIAALNWPLRVIALIPATDNRLDGNAYVPGDIIEMHSGHFVEVLNTDAEGRMILADALSYAKQYDPELVIDIATLTGSAAVAVGNIGTVAMGNAPEENMQQLVDAGTTCYERVVEFPLWEEYDKLLESEVADFKNIGGRDAGAITAGKFLQRFTDYPWIHIDIAGPAFLFSPEGYRTAGGTGTGVRLLLEFIRNKYLND
ncbi:MAG: leucyl aminopeptidase family protein [Bacteroidetes bacterium]|jgi:leucyl aminopeptidase|nr:leucyl aminopeptidase family protein [Bacteroidota bacterium]MBT3749628.1 leucyl aminopeptidase family protein [Bacteroidota bacterium]MBT4399984.1 leucyl aminopeptidase family protein [Bacteroidota bacterium]MBT4411974.1 leucyl aminopeptidase family protein [Bacteroidota bacterium]MBT5427384.1 leucyl aminopeptidase family protein [Bacteroidota bacterium]